ncbi:hypothetical protein Tco_0020101 [Tanacetum coccineum]
MVDSRPVMKQYNKLLRILGQYTQHGLKMDESISVSSIIDKLPPSWKDFKHTLKHSKDDLSLVQLEKGKNKNNKQNKGKKRDFKEHGSGSGSNKKSIGMVDAIAWWIDSGDTTHEAKSKLLEAAKLHVHIGLNTYLGKINTHVPTSSYELSTLNSASNVILEGNWVSHR